MEGKERMDPLTIGILLFLALLAAGVSGCLLIRCWLQGKACPSRGRIDGKVVVVSWVELQGF